MRKLIILFSLLSSLYAGITDFKIIDEAKRAYGAKDYAKSANLLEKLDTKTPQKQYDLGNALYKSKNYDGALEAYKKAKGVDEATRLYNMGNSYFQKKELDKAINIYEESLKLKDDKDTKFNLELAKKMKKRKEQQKKKQQQKKKENKNNKKQNDKKKKNDKKQNNKKQDKQQKKDADKKKSDKKQNDKKKQGDKKNLESKKTKEKKDKAKKEESTPTKAQKQKAKEQKLKAQELKRLMKKMQKGKTPTMMYQMNAGKKPRKDDNVKPW